LAEKDHFKRLKEFEDECEKYDELKAKKERSEQKG